MQVENGLARLSTMISLLAASCRYMLATEIHWLVIARLHVVYRPWYLAKLQKNFPELTDANNYGIRFCIRRKISCV